MPKWLPSILLIPLVAAAQQAGPAPAATAKVLGTVDSVDTATKKVRIKSDSGALWTVDLTDQTTLVRVAPGEKDLTKATRIPLTGVSAGDHVRARGPAGSEPNTLTASSLIVMTKADIAQKQAHDQAEWNRRGIAGIVTAVDPTNKEVTIGVRSMGVVKPVVIQLADGAIIRRYAPDSVKFADAKPSTVADIAPGDQVRALGDRSEDGTHFKAEELVSGSFRTIAAQVISTDPAANTVTVQDLATKQRITVRVNQDTLMRRIPEDVARMMAMRVRAAAGGGQGAGAAAGSQTFAPAHNDATPGQGGAGAQGGWRGGPGGNGGRRFDLQQMLEHMPALAVADLKKGDALIISSTASAEPGNITAINLIAGVEPFLAATSRTASGQYNLGNWNLDMGGGMPGE